MTPAIPLPALRETTLASELTGLDEEEVVVPTGVKGRMTPIKAIPLYTKRVPSHGAASRIVRVTGEPGVALASLGYSCGKINISLSYAETSHNEP